MSEIGAEQHRLAFNHARQFGDGDLVRYATQLALSISLWPDINIESLKEAADLDLHGQIAGVGSDTSVSTNFRRLHALRGDWT